MKRLMSYRARHCSSMLVCDDENPGERDLQIAGVPVLSAKTLVDRGGRNER